MKIELVRPLWLAVVCAVATTASLLQAQIEILENRADLEFPNKVIFTLKAKSTSAIESVSLLYGTDSRTCQSGVVRRKVEIDRGREVEAEWEWYLQDSGALPHGARVWWQWEIQDASGSRVLTPQEWKTVEDDRYRWQSLSRDSVTVSWSRGDQAFGYAILAETLSSLDRLEREIGLYPDASVQVVVYPSAEEVQGSLLHAPEWAGGVAFTDFNIVAVGMGPDQIDWAAEAIPHEMTHLLVGMRVFNCHGVSLPTWLNEGLAVFGEGTLTPDNHADLLRALKSEQLGTLRTLENGFQASGNLTGLSYIYSGEVVTYLITTYGPEKMVVLLDTMKGGQRIETALREVYGFDTDGLDAAWRESVGLNVRLTVPALGATSAATRTPVPTLPLWATMPPMQTATSSMNETAEPDATSTATLDATVTGPELAATAPTSLPLSQNILFWAGGAAGGACVVLTAIALIGLIGRKRT